MITGRRTSSARPHLALARTIPTSARRMLRVRTATARIIRNVRTIDNPPHRTVDTLPRPTSHLSTARSDGAARRCRPGVDGYILPLCDVRKSSSRNTPLLAHRPRPRGPSRAGGVASVRSHVQSVQEPCLGTRRRMRLRRTRGRGLKIHERIGIVTTTTYRHRRLTLGVIHTKHMPAGLGRNCHRMPIAVMGRENHTPVPTRGVCMIPTVHVECGLPECTRKSTILLTR